MPAHFDSDAQDAKLASMREQEEEDLARILSEKYGLVYADLSLASINGDALRLIPEEKAREAEAVAFDKVSKNVSVAVRNPNNPALPPIISGLEEMGLRVQQFMVSQKSIDRALARYKDLSLAHESTAGTFDISGAQLDTLSAQLTSVKALTDHLASIVEQKKGVQISRVFEEVLAAAFVLKASDIHMEPEETQVRLRLRLDGLLTDVFMFEPKGYHFLNSRVKLLSGLKLNVTNRAQDGRFSVAVNGKAVEIRTSVIPGNYGESVVLRILDPNSIQRTFEDAGVNPKLLARLREEIKRPNGMLLTTGPTGSGKTTTLYTFLREMHTPDVKIVTIEDPIEYHLEGIVQTQTNGKDYTFASGLRSVLRQDPDVILVGEIRDAEVAETAIQAALTGHFVFSTLHTNNAAGTFPRLVDLKVDPKLFASAVTVAMAQRLLRTLDDSTKKARPATDAEKKLMEKVLSTLTDKSLIPASFDTVYDAVPSDDGSTGYKGRLGVHEAIFMDDELGTFLRDNPSEGDIAKNVIRQGYPTMAQDAVLKVLAGRTTLEEVTRTVDLPRD
ncbi:MAG: archaeal flagellar protein FlaI [Parcubacteria bacterium C7867-001]|nr:MAG: archaeal flagellar protein FlaI [Parcubacteria bacterium C7867-001]